MFKPLMRRRSWLPILQKLSALAIGILVAAVATELIARALRSGGSRYHVHPSNLSRVLRPAPGIMPGVSGDSVYETNSLGLRSEEFSTPPQHRILALGGSTTECLYLDQTEAWPQLVQEDLNSLSRDDSFWVGNAGKSGLTSRHHIVQASRLPLDEMGIDTALLLVGVNDLLKRLSRDTRYDPHFSEKQGWEQALTREAFYSYPGKDRGPIYRFPATRGWLGQIRRELRTDIIQDSAGLIYTKWRQHRQQASEFRTQLPDLRPALEEFSRNLDEIITIADRKAVRPIFLTQPTIWQEELSMQDQTLLWLGGIGRYQEIPGQPYYSVAALSTGMALYNAAVLEACDRWDLHCLDLATLMPSDPALFYDDIHFNEKGAQITAELVTRHLADW